MKQADNSRRSVCVLWVVDDSMLSCCSAGSGNRDIDTTTGSCHSMYYAQDIKTVFVLNNIKTF